MRAEGPPLTERRPPAPAAGHLRAVGGGLLVTLLWSSSIVLIKIGLRDLSALSFAGLRYGLASMILLALAAQRGSLRRLLAGSRRLWVRLAALGLVYYALTQGAQFLSLAYLTAATQSLVLSFTPVLVVLLGTATLGERTSRAQWVGLVVYLAGAALYLWPREAAGAAPPLVGLAFALLGLLANAVSAILGRGVNRSGELDALGVTASTMTIGALVLLVVGLGVEGVPRVTGTSWLLVGWLAVVNTAVAFTLWNKSLQTLSAMESSVINNAMTVEVPLLAWLFLDEALAAPQVLGLAIAAAGILTVQLGRRARPTPRDDT